MGILDKIYERAILQPLAGYLKRVAESDIQKDAGGAPKALLRDRLVYGNQYAQYGSGKNKPGTLIDFPTLRRFSIQYDVARAAINRRKRQLSQLSWDITAADSDFEVDGKTARQIRREFLDTGGGYRVRFREFLDLMVEDLLVLDAVSIYKQPTLGGGLYALKAIDAATIRLRVAEDGGTPEPPEIAYKQIIRGVEVAEFTADEMYYEMLNPRTDTPYGLSPLESMILTVSTALKSQVANLTMLSEGNIPEGYFGVPDSWSSDQIKQFQELWDASLAGDQVATSRLKFGPEGSYERFIKPEDMRFKELQEWLMKTTCMMFEIPPQELGFTDTVNRATGEVQQDIGKQSGLAPLAKFFEEIFNDVIQQDLGYKDYAFKFMGLDNNDEKAEAETDEVRVRSGVYTVDEVRSKRGLKPIGVDKPFVANGTPTFIDEESRTQKAESAAALANGVNSDGNDKNIEGDDANQTKSVSVDDRHIQLVTEMRTFRKFALERKKAGKPMRYFESEVLPENVNRELNAKLQKAMTTDAIKSIFDEYMQDYQINFLADVIAFKQDLNKIRR